MRLCNDCGEAGEFYGKGSNRCKKCVKARMEELYNAGDWKEK